MQSTVVAGTRPKLIKISPFIHAINRAKRIQHTINYRLVHTRQHYDKKMSDSFFVDLQILDLNANLAFGGDSQAEQTAAIMIAFEKELIENPCAYVFLVGDLTSTIECSIEAKKLNTKVIHVEAEIQSFDMSMPEDINRIVTDSLTDIIFTASEFVNKNLKALGISDNKIHFVVNLMNDSLNANIQKFIGPALFKDNDIETGNFFVYTLHRPSNVDSPDKLKELLDVILKNVGKCKVLFPIHPWTLAIFNLLGISNKQLIVFEPLGYLEFNWLVKNSKAVITDSGGITEETKVMGFPCIILRENTERPVTCSIGSYELVGSNLLNIQKALEKLNSGYWRKGGILELWDDKSSDKIIEILNTQYI